MVQSSGSNFFLKDQVSITGYLNKRSKKTNEITVYFFLGFDYLESKNTTIVLTGQRSKRWKYMYFVLNAAESHLLYFENSKVGEITELYLIIFHLLLGRI